MAAALFAALVLGALLTRRIRYYGYRMRPGLLIAVPALAFAAPPAAAAPTITITARPAVVGALDQVEVSGRVASERSGDEVTLEARQCGGGSVYSRLNKTRTTTLGRWILGDEPSVTTTYRARWRNGRSDTVSVRVRPAILLDAHQRNRFLVIVTAFDSFAGKRAVLERRAGSHWVQVRSFALQRGGAGGLATTRSSAEVRASLPRGTQARVVLSQSQVGRCYLAGVSNTVTA